MQWERGFLGPENGAAGEGTKDSTMCATPLREVPQLLKCHPESHRFHCLLFTEMRFENARKKVERIIVYCLHFRKWFTPNRLSKTVDKQCKQ